MKDKNDIDLFSYIKEREYIDVFSKKLVDDIIEKIENVKQSDIIYKNYKKYLQENFKDVRIDKVENYSFKGNLFVDSIIKSSDPSTRNLGILLDHLSSKYPDVYRDFFNIIIKYLDIGDNGLVYIGQSIDDFKLNSALIYLEKTLSKEETKELGLKFLISIVNPENGYDYEFASLHSFLNQYVNLPGQERLDDMLRFMKECYEHGNKVETIDNMRKLVALVTNGLSFQDARYSGFYDPDSDGIFLDHVCCTSVVAMHEFGHAVDEHYSKRDKSVNHEEWLEKARASINSNPNSATIIKKIADLVQKKGDKIRQDFDDRMEARYGSYEEAIDHFEEYVKRVLQEGKLDKLFKDYNLSDELIDKINKSLSLGILSARDIAYELYNIARDNVVQRTQCNMPETMFLDIISNIFRGFDFTLDSGEYIYLGYGHDLEYYDSYEDSSMCEIYANLNSLLVHGQTELLGLIKDLVGDEFFNHIMEDHNTGRIMDDPKKQAKGRKIA